MLDSVQTETGDASPADLSSTGANDSVDFKGMPRSTRAETDQVNTQMEQNELNQSMDCNDLQFEENAPLMTGCQTSRDKLNASAFVGKGGNDNDDFSMISGRPESESQLSMRHLSEGGKAMRTTDPVSSQFNMLNMYIGIALIALPKAVSEVGFVAAFVGLIIVNLISLSASYFLLKARNRFKR